MTEKLTLKWGTVKGWELDEDGPAFIALKKYFDEGVAMSAMAERDTDAQKIALCEAIDALNGTIFNDWEGRDMTKGEAKKYVMEYGR